MTEGVRQARAIIADFLGVLKVACNLFAVLNERQGIDRLGVEKVIIGASDVVPSVGVLVAFGLVALRFDISHIPLVVDYIRKPGRKVVYLALVSSGEGERHFAIFRVMKCPHSDIAAQYHLIVNRLAKVQDAMPMRFWLLLARPLNYCLGFFFRLVAYPMKVIKMSEHFYLLGNVEWQSLICHP